MCVGIIHIVTIIIRDEEVTSSKGVGNRSRLGEEKKLWKRCNSLDLCMKFSK